MLKKVFQIIDKYNDCPFHYSNTCLKTKIPILNPLIIPYFCPLETMEDMKDV